jgi:methylase of polypeptide subunit release factors
MHQSHASGSLVHLNPVLLIPSQTTAALPLVKDALRLRLSRSTECSLSIELMFNDEVEITTEDASDGAVKKVLDICAGSGPITS